MRVDLYDNHQFVSETGEVTSVDTTHAMTFQGSTGNVGIGTINPQTLFALNAGLGGHDVGITQHQFGGKHTMELTTGDSDGDPVTRILMRGDDDDANIEFYRGARWSEQLSMIIKGIGYVGIGTDSPNSKLEVTGGDIRVTGGSFIDDGTTLDVPDYVFKDSYDLMSLEKLTAFVEENKHLPGIPDASDTAGWAKMSMQERDMKLLEKIEELVRYTTSQHKIISKQQKEIEKLTSEVKRLNNKEFAGLISE